MSITKNNVLPTIEDLTDQLRDLPIIIDMLKERMTEAWLEHELAVQRKIIAVAQDEIELIKSRYAKAPEQLRDAEYRLERAQNQKLAYQYRAKIAQLVKLAQELGVAGPGYTGPTTDGPDRLCDSCSNPFKSIEGATQCDDCRRVE